MSISRLLAITRKEFRHILRDVRTFFLVTIAPAFLLITLSYVFVFDVTRIDLAVQDLDLTPVSRSLIASLTADGDVVIAAYVEEEAELPPLFIQDAADAGLVIPHGFADAVMAGGPAQLHSILNGADAIATGQTFNMLTTRVDAWSAGLQVRGAETAQANFDVSSRTWYNETLESLISMVPGLIAVIMCMPALALALALTREVETGSFENLVVTPTGGTEYLVGKLLAYGVSGLGSALLTWLVATTWFGVPFRGEILSFLLLTADYMIASMGISLVIANFVRNQQTAMFLMLMVFFVPSFFIAGLIIPVADGPVMQVIAHVLPTTHFITICRGIFLKGLGPITLWKPALALLGTGVTCLAISLVLFEKKIQ